MHFLAYLHSPCHPEPGGGPFNLAIASIFGIALAAYGLWMIVYPDRCLEWFENRLAVLEQNPYKYDPVRLNNKKNALMKYVFADNPTKRVRSTGQRMILFALLFELVLWGFVFFGKGIS